MKELVVIVRREKSAEVKSFLSSMGLDYVSKTVKGRGKGGAWGTKQTRELSCPFCQRPLYSPGWRRPFMKR